MKNNGTTKTNKKINSHLAKMKLTEVPNVMDGSTTLVPHLGFTSDISESVQDSSDDPDGTECRGCQGVRKTREKETDEEGGEGLEGVSVCSVGE